MFLGISESSLYEYWPKFLESLNLELFYHKI